jgi:hypothetical protein
VRFGKCLQALASLVSEVLGLEVGTEEPLMEAGLDSVGKPSSSLNLQNHPAERGKNDYLTGANLPRALNPRNGKVLGVAFCERILLPHVSILISVNLSISDKILINY